MQNIKDYERDVFYYETDQMQVVHHSNYIRWFEECRTDFLAQVGLSYAKMEEEKIIVPVLGVKCEYKKPFRFGERFKIKMRLENFTGVKMHIVYEVMEATTGEVRTIGESYHGFVNENMMPIRMKKEYPDVYEKLMSCVEKEEK